MKPRRSAALSSLALSLCCLLALTGCATATKPAQILPRSPAEADVLGLVFAAVDRAVTDLLTLPPSPARTAALLNLGLAQAGRVVPSTPAHTGQAADISAAALAGDTAKAEALAATGRDDLLKQLGAAERERDTARQALEDERRRHQAELAAAKEEVRGAIWSKIQFWGAAALYAVAIAALVLAFLRAKAALASGLDIMAGIKSTATLCTLSATCFSVARFMASTWFWWGCGGVLALFLGYLGWLAYQERKGAAAAAALRPIRRVLDRAYEQAVESGTAADMERTIFEPIATEMKALKAPRRYLHLDRATEPATAA